MRDDAGTVLGNRLRHVPVIVIGPRKPSFRGDTPNESDLLEGIDCAGGAIRARDLPDTRGAHRARGSGQDCQDARQDPGRGRAAFAMPWEDFRIAALSNA